MKINEVENLLKITKPNIRFYEKKGLLCPVRKENGYREYSEDDIEILKKIILFRKMGISIGDIKALLDGQEKLSEVVDKNVAQLEEQMKELQGALHISRKMQRDTELDEAFDLDRYWNEMQSDEAQGSKFFEVVKDYMEFESYIFFGTWKYAFFVNLRKLTAGKKFIVAVLFVASFCLVRGLAYHYIWKLGSIVEGAIYPFVIFAMASLLILPLYVLNKVFGREEEDDVRTQTKDITAKGCLGTLLSILLVLVSLFLLILGVPCMVEELYLNRINEGLNYVSSSPVYMIFFIMTLYFFVTICWLISKKGVSGNRFQNEKGLVCHLPKKLRVVVAVAALILYLAAIWLYTVCYNQIDDNGFHKYRVFTTTHYRYEDVEYYQVYAQSDGTLGVYFRMKDGSKIEYYRGLMSYNIDETRYPDGSDDYVIEIVKRLKAVGVECRVPNEEKLYKKLTYDYWDEVAKKILEIAGVSDHVGRETY